jgi:hypothetical protein
VAAPVFGGIYDAATAPAAVSPFSAFFLILFDVKMTYLPLFHANREHEMLTGQVRGLPLRIASPAPAPGPPPPDSPSACMPELAALRGMDQVAVVGRLLSAARAVTAGATLAPGDAARLYALSARLERPLHADTAAAYRALLRRCKEWRSGATGPADPLLPHLSVLIAIAGAYFRQDEELAAMWDREEEEYDEESEFAVS